VKETVRNEHELHAGTPSTMAEMRSDRYNRQFRQILASRKRDQMRRGRREKKKDLTRKLTNKSTGRRSSEAAGIGEGLRRPEMEKWSLPSISSSIRCTRVSRRFSVARRS
jgi:hypothetical protein